MGYKSYMFELSQLTFLKKINVLAEKSL